MRKSLTVCIATYNGEAYVRSQLDSIYSELEPHDRVIIVDDASTDGTPKILSAYASRPDTYVMTLERNVGHVKAFEESLSMVSTPLVVLSDQDDLWPTGRIALLLAALGDDCLLATGSFQTFGQKGKAQRLSAQELGGTLNIMNALSGGLWGGVPYWGSCMLFRTELINFALPFPAIVDAHDQWIGILANLLGKTAHTNDVVTLRRLHSDNLSARMRRPFGVVLRGKMRLLGAVFVAMYRAKKGR